MVTGRADLAEKLREDFAYVFVKPADPHEVSKIVNEKCYGN